MTHWPHVHGVAASASVWLRAKESENSAAPWAKWLEKNFTLLIECQRRRWKCETWKCGNGKCTQ